MQRRKLTRRELRRDVRQLERVVVQVVVLALAGRVFDVRAVRKAKACGASSTGSAPPAPSSTISTRSSARSAVAAGGTAFDPKVVKTLVGGRRRSSLEELTDRERDVLSLIAEGRSNRAIGKQLFLSSRAVEHNVQTIFRKLGLADTEDDNRRVLAVLALLGH